MITQATAGSRTGIRADSKTRYTPKVMLELADGKPLIQRNLEWLRDAVGISDFTVVVGYRADQIRDTLETGRALTCVFGTWKRLMLPG